MVESAGGRGRVGPGPSPARRSRGELSAARAPASLRTPTPARAGKEPWLPERSSGMKCGFWDWWPGAAEAACREPGVPERLGWWFGVPFSAL